VIAREKTPRIVRRGTNIGLIGCGLWGRNILRELQHLGVRVVVAESGPENRATANSAGAEAVVATVGELPQVDGFIVATPASTHAGIAASLLSRDVPVFVEKPLTTSVAEAEQLAETGAGRLFVMHIWRYHPGVQLLAEIARSGELGPVHGLRSTRANWRSPRLDVDTVWNLAPHDLTLTLAVLGKIPQPRFALAEMLDGRAVGIVAVLGEIPWAVFELSNRYRDKRREVRLHCRDGVAVMANPDNNEIELIREGDLSIPFNSRTEKINYAVESPLRRELQAFIEHLAGGPPPPTGVEEGVAVVKAVAEIRRLAGLG
jgi:predicted dehydrogenase